MCGDSPIPKISVSGTHYLANQHPSAGPTPVREYQARQKILYDLEIFERFLPEGH